MGKTRVLKYISKPQEVEVMRFDGTEESATRICDWVNSNGQQAYVATAYTAARVLRIVTDNSSDSVSEGDYVIKLRPYIFEVGTSEYFAENYEKP